jgi:hypothetical protein
LSATIDKPLFSPARRPPAKPVAPVARQEAPPPPPPPSVVVLGIVSENGDGRAQLLQGLDFDRIVDDDLAACRKFRSARKQCAKTKPGNHQHLHCDRHLSAVPRSELVVFCSHLSACTGSSSPRATINLRQERLRCKASRY